MTQPLNRVRKPGEIELIELSELVRKGEPIGLCQAIAVIEYQERLRQERENSFLGRLKRWARTSFRVRDEVTDERL